MQRAKAPARAATIRLGVVGYGVIGRHHARNVGAMRGVELTGVVDSSPTARAEAERAGHRAFSSIGALLRAGIDGAIVAVPTSAHETVAAQLIRAARPILVEKPLAPTLAAAKRIIALAQAARVPLMVGYVERYNPAVEALRSFLESGKLGGLISISARRVGAFPPRVRDANVLVDIGVHDIDLVAYLTGAYLTLTSAQGGMAVQHDQLDFANLLLDAEGCLVSIEANWITPIKLREMSLTGTNGFCRVDYITQEASFVRGRSFSPTTGFEEQVAQYKAGLLTSLPVRKREPLARQLEVFVAGVRGAQLPDPHVARASLRIAEEATAEITRQQIARGTAARPA